MDRYAPEFVVVWRGGGGHIPHEALEWFFSLKKEVMIFE
jgi:hypothetical protein